MSDRLAGVERRIATTHQLSAIITAMRGIAAVRSHEARQQLDGIRAYSAMVGHGIAHALALGEADALPDARPLSPHEDGRPGGRHAVIAFTAEQGFAGSFSERVLEQALTLLDFAHRHDTALLLIGDRGLMAAAERDVRPDWQAPMIARVDQAAALANRIMGELLRRFGLGHLESVSVVYAMPSHSGASDIVKRRLVPFDYSRFPPVRQENPPLTTLAADALLSKLSAEYMFAELCEAVILSFAAENEARVAAMIAARQSVDDTLSDLTAKSRLLRQDAITSELVELAGGARARKRSKAQRNRKA
ncbi:F-ATPase gamma subunit, sodium ion specific [Hartmannibacter diazotrophicus]|uniref:F-ATPase gamma subunit, sodium ion specific n=1 Tax=Hartmannibacter diazotrophicus TaxID=1482074 RepID=A0A2C9D4N2_9HYPH|nr:FoF1 ATP synthase subunit gamma [Hartmannibacter diazotrophicus]SON55129.1 F-ATPase gamma subunit, sodium ion specific [Hartmannibacter diazotrophicus]